MQTHQIIITTRPESAAYALSELQNYDRGIRPVSDLQPGVKLVHLPGGYERLLADAPPLIFVRHMFPVQWRGDGGGEGVDAAAMSEGVRLPGLDAGAFSVQMRGAVGSDSLPTEFIRELEAALLAKGYVKDDKTPAWALSVYFHADKVYAGASMCADNRSAWNGGAVWYSKGGDFISRAEFKLTEALEVFSLPVIPGGRALDLGAAPGGWSKALLARGMHVTAVDPAALDPRLEHPRLSYICATAQRFFAEYPVEEPFGLLVNDMKMDMFDSARVMLDASRFLAPSGKALMTLKLARGQGLSKIYKALGLLAQKYRVVNTRQLFYNRDEVTAVMHTKNGCVCHLRNL